MNLRFFLIIFLISVFFNSKSISNVKKSKWTRVGEDTLISNQGAIIVSVDLGTIVKKNDVYIIDWVENHNKPFTTPNSEKALSFWGKGKIKCGKNFTDFNEMKTSYIEYYDQRMQMDGINMINKGKIVDKFQNQKGKWYKFDENNNYNSVGYYLTSEVCIQHITPEKIERIEGLLKSRKK
ncbi:hypothetical protein OA074_00865 [bacterium]|nr:hypothetical protein [bacterium]